MGDGRTTALLISDLTVSVPGRRLCGGLSFSVGPGECVAVMGPSGSGKTTLLNAIAGIHRPDGGAIAISQTAIWSLEEDTRSSFRLRRIGFVFQFGELLPELSVAENVGLPLRLAGVSRAEAMKRSMSELAAIGLAELAARNVEGLSGGETQRVALARALVHRPVLLLADEPTGSLDEANAQRVAALIGDECRRRGVAAVVATHDPVVAERMDRIVRLRDNEVPAAALRPVEAIVR